MDQNKNNRIFISYAKEDIIYAERLYDFLLSKSYNPWLDKKKLNVGQDWEFHLQDALHKADFIVLLLSKASVNKRGYVQREFKKALYYCEEKLQSDIFIIPIKIDNCEVPMNLNKFQWVEYENNAFEQIVNSIEIQRNSLLNSPSTIEVSNQSIEISNIVKQGEYGDISPKHIYEFHYPQFDYAEEDTYKELNTLIQNEVLVKLLSVRSNYFGYLLTDGSVNALDQENPEDSSSFGRIEISLINSNIISTTSFLSEYHTGAAHGMFGTAGYNYYMNPLRKFEFIDLFSDRNNYLQVIRDLVHEKLMVIAEKSESYYSIEDGNEEPLEMSPEDKRNSFYVYNDGLLPIEENFDNYFFKENSIVFIFNPYHITAWSEGAHYPEITFSELIDNFPKEDKLIAFIKSAAFN